MKRDSFTFDRSSFPSWVEEPVVFQVAGNTVYGHLITGTVDNNTVSLTPLRCDTPNYGRKLEMKFHELHDGVFYWSLDKAIEAATARTDTDPTDRNIRKACEEMSFDFRMSPMGFMQRVAEIYEYEHVRMPIISWLNEHNYGYTDGDVDDIVECFNYFNKTYSHIMTRESKIRHAYERFKTNRVIDNA